MKKTGGLCNFNEKLKKEKKALSPVIATILLISLAVLLILIFLLLSKTFIKEIVEKNDQPAEYSCENVNLEVELSSDELQIVNRGNVPIHRVVVKKIKKGKSEVSRSDIINDLYKGGSVNLNRDSLGISESELNDGGYITDGKLNIIPVLRGTVKDGSFKEYQCPDKFGTIYYLG